MSRLLFRSGALSLALMAVLSPAWADGQLYQWKDASGRVHFSDSAPAADPVSSSRSLAREPSLPRVSNYPPVALSGGKRHPLAVSLPDYSALQGAAELGKLYVAGDCIHPTSLGWKELQGPGSIFMEGNRRFLAESIAGVLKAQGYDAEVAASEDRWQGLAAAGAMRLIPRVVAVDIRVCAPRYTGLQVRQGDIRRLVQVSGERAGSWMKIRWELWRNNGQVPLRIFETEGSLMQWQGGTSLWNVMHESARHATRNLTGFPALGQSLLVTAPVVAKATAAESSPGLAGLMDDLNARYVLQARVANVLSIISPFKVMLVEYFQSEGRWPTDISVLEPNPSRRQQPGLVDEVALGAEGELIVSLSPKLYPRGYLRLKPVEGGMAISWSCRSNLPAGALGGPDGFCHSDAR